MAIDEAIILTRWETPCSDLLSLFFVRLVDEGKRLVFTVRDETLQYQFVFQKFGPYQVADEAFLEAYQVDTRKYAPLSISPENFPGRTCLVSNSLWKQSFKQSLLELYFPASLQHYSITTSDSSLDILAAALPTISVFKTSEIK